MDCKKCQYHTKDGRCLYYIGCPYEPTPNDGDETKAFWNMILQSPGVKDIPCDCLTEPPKPKMPEPPKEDDNA